MAQYEMKANSINDLRVILENERKAKGRGRIGDKTLKVLADLLSRPGIAAVDSISSLAAYSGVDPSTLTRLGKRLGFSGFGELQDVFRQHVARTQPFYSRRIQERIEEPLGDGAEGLLQQHARTECQRLVAAVESMDPQTIEQAADLLVAARHVYVLGMRATYALSYFMGSYLGTFRQNVNILSGPGVALGAEISRITTEDLLVAVSFRPYTKLLVKAVEVVKESGIPVLAITDAGSVFSTEPGQGVTVAIDQPYYFDSATAQFFMIQTLLLAVARRLGPDAVDIAKRREQIFRALDIDVP